MESLLPLVELVDNSYLFHLVNGGIAPAGPHPHSRITSQQHELEGNALIDLWRLVVFLKSKSHLVAKVTPGHIRNLTFFINIISLNFASLFSHLHCTVYIFQTTT